MVLKPVLNWIRRRSPVEEPKLIDPEELKSEAAAVWEAWETGKIHYVRAGQSKVCPACYYRLMCGVSTHMAAVHHSESARKRWKAAQQREVAFSMALGACRCGETITGTQAVLEAQRDLTKYGEFRL